jgi:F-type H+-transporting ATPase subunit b
MEGLGIDIKSLIFQLVNFSILILILGRLLYKPIIRMLDSRSEAIKRSLAETEKIKKELAEIKERQNQIILQAREQAKDILSKETERARLHHDESLKKTAKEVEELIDRGEAGLIKQKEEFSQNLRLEVAEMVRESVRRILSQGLSDDERERLVREGLKKIS